MDPLEGAEIPPFPGEQMSMLGVWVEGGGEEEELPGFRVQQREEKRMGAPVRRWEPAVHEETKRLKQQQTYVQPGSFGDRKKTSQGSEDCAEFATAQKVTELTETKPGRMHPPHTTQGGRWVKIL